MNAIDCNAVYDDKNDSLVFVDDEIRPILERYERVFGRDENDISLEDEIVTANSDCEQAGLFVHYAYPDRSVEPGMLIAINLASVSDDWARVLFGTPTPAASDLIGHIASYDFVVFY